MSTPGITPCTLPENIVARLREWGCDAALPAVQALTRHPDFHIGNPNRARSLVSTFCANPGAFHRADGAGYQFWAERVLQLDAFNPQVAARLARALDRWSKLAEPWRGSARAAIERVAAHGKLSNDVREVVTRALEPA